MIAQLDAQAVLAAGFNRRDQASEIGGLGGASGFGRGRGRDCDFPTPCKLGQKRCRIRQIRAVDQPEQRHRGGFVRVGRDLDIREAFEQHLPQAVERAP